MQIVLILAVFFLARGVNMVGMRLGQKDNVNTFMQSVVFTTVYCVLQAVILLVIPPYKLIVPEARFYLYPLGFAIFYFLGNVLLIKSFSMGPSSIANTIASFNSLIAIAFSVIAWGETLSVFKIIGLALFVAGLIIYNKSSYSVDGEKKSISPKWIGLVLASMFSNGIAVIFTKMSMRDFPQYSKEYLVYFTLIAALIGLIVILVRGRTEARKLIREKRLWKHTAYAAASLDVSNIIFVAYINLFPTALFLPLTSVLGMLAILIFGRLILHERVSKSALVSSVICIIAILFLNF
ncbi:MAG: EamA family transporter [Clostridia bacterium]